MYSVALNANLLVNAAQMCTNDSLVTLSQRISYMINRLTRSAKAHPKDLQVAGAAVYLQSLAGPLLAVASWQEDKVADWIQACRHIVWAPQRSPGKPCGSGLCFQQALLHVLCAEAACQAWHEKQSPQNHQAWSYMCQKCLQHATQPMPHMSCQFIEETIVIESYVQTLVYTVFQANESRRLTC